MKLSERIFKGKKHYLTSKFGYRKNPVTGKKAFHNGVDYGTNRVNLYQYALEDGVVLSVNHSKSGYGNSIWVRYPRLGYSLFHAHLDIISVKKGQKVDKNTVLGTTGNSGSSTATHLHLGVQPIGSNTWLDPEKIDYKEVPRYNLKRVLKFGSRGSDVKQLQIRLNELGFGILKLDGRFGFNTANAVKQLQKKYKLKVDGVVGQNTAHKLGWLYKGK